MNLENGILPVDAEFNIMMENKLFGEKVRSDVKKVSLSKTPIDTNEVSQSVYEYSSRVNYIKLLIIPPKFNKIVSNLNTNKKCNMPNCN